MPFAENMAPFFADFGLDCVLAGSTVRAIFDAPGQVQPLGIAGMATVMPQITLPTASVPAAPVGVPVDVPGQGRFQVAEHQPDGTGVSVLLLERMP